MPFTIYNVDSHKKGLTPAQKKKWVKIANSILSKTGNDASAIRIANSKCCENKIDFLFDTILTLTENDLFKAASREEQKERKEIMIKKEEEIIKKQKYVDTKLFDTVLNKIQRITDKDSIWFGCSAVKLIPINTWEFVFNNIPYAVFATPFWEMTDGIPIQIMKSEHGTFDASDSIGERTAPLKITFNPEIDADAYMKAVETEVREFIANKK